MDEDDIVDDTPFGGEDHIDTEEDIKRRKDERAAVLGFYPQKEIIYNSLLPYSDRMDEESHRLWQEIKTNFGRAICLHELRPGYVIWSGRLIKYIHITFLYEIRDWCSSMGVPICGKICSTIISDIFNT